MKGQLILLACLMAVISADLVPSRVRRDASMTKEACRDEWKDKTMTWLNKLVTEIENGNDEVTSAVNAVFDPTFPSTGPTTEETCQTQYSDKLPFTSALDKIVANLDGNTNTRSMGCRRECSFRCHLKCTWG